ncbi:unnamed protein product, partial [Mesorhabditis spiculigera]
MSSVQMIECRSAPIERVTVFNDRAEIRRNFSIKLEAGMNDINIINLPGDIADDSVRISGSGDALIHEVQIAWKEATAKEKDCSKASELRQKVEEEERELKTINIKKTILQKKKAALDELINKLGNTDGIRSIQISNETFNSVNTLFAFYAEQFEGLSVEESKLEDVQKEHQERLNNYQTELHRYTFPGSVKVISIVLEAAEAGEVSLTVSYQVFNASWRPAYDIRVENKEEKHMNITYYGRVQQGSGEDWANCQLVLSTAQPSAGGTIPELGTMDVSLYVKPEPMENQAYGGRGMAFGATCMQSASMAAPERMRRAMKTVTATVQEQALSSEFIIARPAVIPPDNSEHKVTIGAASFVPKLNFECVPAKNNNVFLTAAAVNSSNLPFLPGEAAVFLDTNFINKSQLKAVSPGEHFNVSLGVDASIKVDYKPAHDKKGQSGLITKTSSTQRHQKVVIKNTKKESVLVTIHEQIPRSTDEKITVKVLSPTAPVKSADEGAGKEEGAFINAATNNLEVTVSIPEHDKKELDIKYQIDFPGGEKLDYNEKY